MVIVTDVAKERKAFEEKYKQVYNLAKAIFGKETGESNLEIISISEPDSSKMDPAVEISLIGVIEVNNNLYFDRAMKFARQAEKILGIEIELRKNY